MQTPQVTVPTTPTPEPAIILQFSIPAFVFFMTGKRFMQEVILNGHSEESDRPYSRGCLKNWAVAPQAVPSFRDRARSRIECTVRLSASKKMSNKGISRERNMTENLCTVSKKASRRLKVNERLPPLLETSYESPELTGQEEECKFPAAWSK